MSVVVINYFNYIHYFIESYANKSKIHSPMLHIYHLVEMIVTAGRRYGIIIIVNEKRPIMCVQGLQQLIDGIDKTNNKNQLATNFIND